MRGLAIHDHRCAPMRWDACDPRVSRGCCEQLRRSSASPATCPGLKPLTRLAPPLSPNALQSKLRIIIITSNFPPTRQPRRKPVMPHRWRRLAALAALAGAALLAAGCSSSLALEAAAPNGTIVAVGAENQYANVIQQVGGKYVQVSAIISNPSTDPHTFEAGA